MIRKLPIDVGKVTQEDLDRFWVKVNKDGPGGCWLWTAGTGQNGYGRFRFLGRNVYAHRFSFALAGGELDTALELDHLCRVRNCVNPEHIEQVTGRTNTLRGDTIVADNASRTHCPAGHVLEGDNLVPTAIARGRRACLTCNRERAREQTAAIREARTLLGLTWREYTEHFGQSKSRALAIVEAHTDEWQAAA